jgi:predicted transcriptional regulator
LTDSEPSQENVRHLPAKTGEFRPRPRDIGRQTRAGILTRAQRRNRVLELRAAGLTEQQIADQLGMTQGAVSKIINKALRSWAEADGMNIEMVRAQKLFELDQLKKAIWARALQGELAAVREATKIIQAQSKISGADAPVRVERHTTVELEVDSREIQRMEDAWLHSGGSVIDAVVADDEQS